MRVGRVVVLASTLTGCGLSVVGLAVPSEDDAGVQLPVADASSVEAAQPDVGASPLDAAPDVVIVDDAGSPAAGEALSFNGAAESVRMMRPVADDFTLEAWIRTSDSGGAAGGNFYDGPPVFHSDTPGPNNDFGSSILNKKFAFGSGMPDTAVVSTSDVATGAWVHIAAVRVKSSGTVSVFVNGVQEASTSGLNTASLNATATMDIGVNFGNGHFFNGIVDEVRAWNIARTATQIQATMRTRLAGNEAGLVGYWRFDDGSGTTASDSSPTHNNGLLGNGDAAADPTWVLSTAF